MFGGENLTDTEAYSTFKKCGSLDYLKLITEGKLVLSEHSLKWDIPGEWLGCPCLKSGQFDSDGNMHGVAVMLVIDGFYRGMMIEG